MKVEKTHTSKEVVTTVDVEQFVLTLTREEAETLRRICEATGGSPTGRRGHMDSIMAGLVSCGVADPGIAVLDSACNTIFFI